MWGVVVMVVVVAGLRWLLQPLRPTPFARRPPPADSGYKQVDWEGTLKARVPATHKQYLVIGAGSLGLSVLRALLLRGETKVRAMDIRRPSSLPKGVHFVLGSVTNPRDLDVACAGVDVVFLTAACIRYWERLPHQIPPSFATNVEGPRHAIAACLRHRVSLLIHTSSANVTLASVPSPAPMSEGSVCVTRATAPNHYGWTKAEGEGEVLAADGRAWEGGGGVLRTGAVRPCSMVIGPNDGIGIQHWLSTGNHVLMRNFLLDVVFVENVTYGHLLLERALLAGNPLALGRPFCVSNNDPVMFEDLLRIAVHYHPSLKLIYSPHRLLTLVAHAVEAFHAITRSRVSLGDLDKLTPAMLLCCQHYTFDTRRSRDVLGYEPLFSLEQGVQRSVDEWRAANGK